ncbi:unnamed protein product [Cylindrotheca closterium]|uniref:holo-[acyl-carrier-protein] synthase n=1 Tax=Cylindrotheca closterium TaxID=2856 RepID=A0AAD2CH00_9STRA|nr:unnamed protein product [Cylindrotheca closterium]
MGNTLNPHQVHGITLNLLEISREVEDDADGTAINDLALVVLKETYKAELWPDQKASSIEETATVQKKVLSFLKIQDKWTALGSILLKSQAFHITQNSQDGDRIMAILPRTEHRKPYIPTDKKGLNNNMHSLSISHQFPFVGAFLLDNTGVDTQRMVGLDIVTFDEYNKRLYSNEDEFLDVFRDSFTKQEWTAINAMEQHRLKEFFVRWATKEAYTKALGVGLGFEFNSFDIQFKSFENGELINTGLWNLICSMTDGVYLSATINGGMNVQGNSLEVWEFFFLPLTSRRAETATSGCSCACLGPFGSLTSEPRMKVNIGWTKLDSLLKWHRDES